MDELIVELLNKYSSKGMINLNPLEFAEAIQTACKAQRNACARVHNQYICSMKVEKDNINNAEIQRQDYENN